MRKYYRIKSIERNKKYDGDTFWTAGYQYTYTAVSNGHDYMFDRLKEFNDKLEHKRNHLVIDIRRVFDKQQSVVQIKGKKKLVNQFITYLLLSDFSNHFTFNECPYWDINYKSYT